MFKSIEILLWVTMLREKQITSFHAVFQEMLGFFHSVPEGGKVKLSYAWLF